MTTQPPTQPATPTSPPHVVTAFLLRTDRGRDEILLVRRSERVRTYRGAWAAISGYLEPGVTPLDQAYTELSEEASLPRDAVELLRVGAPLPVRDEAQGRELLGEWARITNLAPRRDAVVTALTAVAVRDPKRD